MADDHMPFTDEELTAAAAVPMTDEILYHKSRPMRFANRIHLSGTLARPAPFGADSGEQISAVLLQCSRDDGDNCNCPCYQQEGNRQILAV